MDTRTAQKLLRLIASGADTYADIQKALPEIDHSDLYFAAFCLPTEDRLLQEINPRSRSRDEEYTFRPDDRFTLTDLGKNLLSEANEKEYLRKLAAKNIALAKKSACYARCSAIAAIIGTIIGIGLAILQIYISLR